MESKVQESVSEVQENMDRFANFFFNHIKPAVSYLTHGFLRPLNDQHRKALVHNLLHAF